MTFVFNQNITPANGADALFQWKNFMKTTPAWTVVASGDGLSAYSASGDIITSSTVSQHGVAGSLFNPGAWFVIQQPSSTRQFCFQSFGNYYIPNPAESTATSWRIKYSITGFTVGGSATVTPTASTSIDAYTNGAENAAVVLGSALGTDAHPSGGTLFGTDGTYRMQMGADAAAPNAFYWFCSTITTTTISAGFLFDPMASGTAPAGDMDQYVIYYSASSNAFGSVNSLITYGNCPAGFIKKNLPGETFTSIGAAVYSLQGSRNLQQTIGYMPSNPYNNTDDLLPIVYMSAPFFIPNNSPISPAVLGYKGVSGTAKWCTTDRNNLDMLSVMNPGDRILVENIALPWNNTSPII